MQELFCIIVMRFVCFLGCEKGHHGCSSSSAIYKNCLIICWKPSIEKGWFLNHNVVSQNCDANIQFTKLSGYYLDTTFAKLFLCLTGSDFKQYWIIFSYLLQYLMLCYVLSPVCFVQFYIIVNMAFKPFTVLALENYCLCISFTETIYKTKSFCIKHGCHALNIQWKLPTTLSQSFSKYLNFNA